MAKVVSINISKKKGVAKIPIDSGYFKINVGLVGDAHSGPGNRQVSLLAKESIERFEKLKKVCIKRGVFGENLTTEGIELHNLKIGTRLKINKVVLEVSKIGKECHDFCSIGKKAGDCIMPKEGIFAKVIEEGEIRVGDKIVVI
jgi:MOSC domain-containing protein YiiM